MLLAPRTLDMGMPAELWSVLRVLQEFRPKDGEVRTDVNVGLQELDSLRRQYQALALTCQAMWEVLSERLGVTEDQLRERIQALDLRDGKLDGRLQQPQQQQCPGCGTRIQANRPSCYVCGRPLTLSRPFGG